MLAKPPFPFPPMLRQTFKIQLVYQNAENLIDFKYLPFYETEQDLAILGNSASIGELALKTSEDIAMLQIARADYYKFKQITNKNIEIIKANLTNLNDISNDYHKFKGETNERLGSLETRASENEEKISEIELSLLESNANLGNEILKNAEKIGIIGTYLKINF